MLPMLCAWRESKSRTMYGLMTIGKKAHAEDDQKQIGFKKK
jgi:hypothetical protein